jgi:carbonic anhydrase
MEKNFLKILRGYQAFRKKYAHGNKSIMRYLSDYGQQPRVMIVACCDSRVDPALILQCNPGDLFVVRNVANIVPPYEKDEAHHGTSAALEFGICALEVEHLILLGHSQCGGIQALIDSNNLKQNDFITSWVSLIKKHDCKGKDIDDYAKSALNQSYQNCLTFPWIKERIAQKKLTIHLWFFDIKTGQIFTYCDMQKEYQPLDASDEVSFYSEQTQQS